MLQLPFHFVLAFYVPATGCASPLGTTTTESVAFLFHFNQSAAVEGVLVVVKFNTTWLLFTVDVFLGRGGHGCTLFCWSQRPQPLPVTWQLAQSQFNNQKLQLTRSSLRSSNLWHLLNLSSGCKGRPCNYLILDVRQICQVVVKVVKWSRRSSNWVVTIVKVFNHTGVRNGWKSCSLTEVQWFENLWQFEASWQLSK